MNGDIWSSFFEPSYWNTEVKGKDLSCMLLLPNICTINLPVLISTKTTTKKSPSPQYSLQKKKIKFQLALFKCFKFSYSHLDISNTYPYHQLMITGPSKSISLLFYTVQIYLIHFFELNKVRILPPFSTAKNEWMQIVHSEKGNTSNYTDSQRKSLIWKHPSSI